MVDGLDDVDLSNSTVGVTVDEDQADNSERSHTQETVGLLIFSQDFVFDSTFSTLTCGLVSEYRMDECYWLGSGNFDVTDHQAGNNAEAYNNASTDKNDAIINFSGGFIATGYFQPENAITLNSEWTYSYWMKFPLDSTDHEDFSSTTFGFDYYFVSGSLVGTGRPSCIYASGHRFAMGCV